MDTRSKLLFTQLKNFTADVCLVRRLLEYFMYFFRTQFQRYIQFERKFDINSRHYIFLE